MASSLIAIMCYFIYSSCILSNSIYVHYNMMFVEAESICTRLISRIEMVEGFQGDETIVFLGDLQKSKYFHPNSALKESDELFAFVGPHNGNNLNALNYNSWIKKYMNNVLNYSLDVTGYLDYDDMFLENRRKMFQEMTCYPIEGSVVKDGEYVFVKLSEIDDDIQSIY